MNFIDQSNPDAPLKLDEIDLREQYTSLTDEEKLLIFCKLSGYYKIPPSIERLYSDDYYLGSDSYFSHGDSIYPFWKDALKTIFPNEVFTSKPFLILSGAIGIGKSTISKICLAYTYSRLLCMKNPYKNLGLAPKILSAVLIHRNEDTIIKEEKDWFDKDVLLNSPFFKNTKPNFKFRIVTGGPRSSGGIGTDAIFFQFGEINFFDNQEQAQQKVSTGLIRFTSRFNESTIKRVGMFILDSSAAGNSSTTEWFLENTNPDLTWNCTPSHWKVKPGSYKESNGKTFKVYTGDGKYPPQILAEDYRLGLDQDPDKVISVPIQLLPEAKASIISMLRDKAGISTGSSDSFFGGSIEHLVKCSKIKNLIPETIKVDFYDKSDRLITKIEPMLKDVKPKTPIWLGLDLGIKSDTTGISAVTFDGWNIVHNVRLPKVKCIFTVGVTRKEGQQTSLFHIYDLITELSKRFSLIVSADQAFSAQILQDCERDGIKTAYVSTDRTPEPAFYLKNLINQELIILPEHKRLQREAYDLKYTTTAGGKTKIDHPKKATQDPLIFDVNDGVGSKDIFDSLENACYSLKLSIDAGEELGYNSNVNRQINILSEITKSASEEVNKKFQDLLEGIF